MQKNDVRRSMRNFVKKVLLVSAFVMILTNASYMLMTWIFTDILEIQNEYLSSEVRFLGTLVIAMIFLFILFSGIYRKRKRELIRLTEHIEKVARGDFSARISYNKRDSMSHVYSDINHMTEELRSVQVLRKDFINSFSHEFKTPIASINGFSSLMLEKKLPREEEEVYLKIIKEESERLSKMTNNTILLTKLSSREVVSRTEVYNLGEQLRQCSILLSRQWMEKGLEFDGDFPDIEYEGNKELLQHLWINLISNAIKYTPSGGEIVISAVRTAEYITVTVADTGIGMTEETLAHIFDDYFQGDVAHANPGLGLGLSIARQIVQICGGTIEAKSKKDEGSTFTVLLPFITTVKE